VDDGGKSWFIDSQIAEAEFLVADTASDLLICFAFDATFLLVEGAKWLRVGGSWRQDWKPSDANWSVGKSFSLDDGKVDVFVSVVIRRSTDKYRKERKLLIFERYGMDTIPANWLKEDRSLVSDLLAKQGLPEDLISCEILPFLLPQIPKKL